MLIDLPGLAFFTTYALLVLFWAEIYYQVSFAWRYLVIVLVGVGVLSGS